MVAFLQETFLLFIILIVARFRVFPKQWPLAGEFVEFEYSPKIRHFFCDSPREFGEY
jgi:hypothetical protein